MSNADITREERCAAALAAGEQALAALAGSGAPLLALSGAPLRVVHANAAARRIFGDDLDGFCARLLRTRPIGAIQTLGDILDELPDGAPPRLERLRGEIGGCAQTVTLLCQRLEDGAGFACFALAGLGLRAPEGVTPEPEQDVAALRAELAARHGARPPRFLWKTDANGRFTEISHALADVVGGKNADLLGRSAREVAAALDLGDAFAEAVASEKSWSGLEIFWPLETSGARAPATLGGMPVFDSARRFAGFNGYGVFDLSRAIVAAPAAPAVETPETPPPPPPVEPPKRDDDGRVAAPPANVVPLRPHLPLGGLSATERSAFDEIARALTGGQPSPSAARALLEQVGRAVEGAPPSEPEIVAPTAATPRPGSGPAPAAETPAPVIDPPPSEPEPLRMARLLDRLPVGVLVARGDEALFANRTLLDYLGYGDLDALDADGGLARVFFGRKPRDLAGRAPPFAVSLQTDEGEAIDADAHLQIIDWDGAGPATLITLRRRRSAAQDAADQAAMQAVLDAAFDAMLLVARDGRILRANDAAAAMTGVAKAALAGQSIFAFVAEDAVRPMRERIARAGETPGAPLPLEVRALPAALTPAQCLVRAIGPASDSVVCVTLRDSAAAQRNREELEQARVEAERASAAKSEFLARISHEIRTPLSAIIGFAEVMMEERFGPVGPPRYKEYLKDIHSSGAHVLSLVNDLLDLSKIEAGKMELDFGRVDANGVISECVSIMQAQANRERVVIRLALSSRLPPIRADERALRQILLNLLSNAVKFNEPGGQVIVSSALTDAGFVVIRVKDTGVGMTQEEIQTALEPFRQVATKRGKVAGTGLGLPLTKALIEANQAAFTIRSRRNEGTLIEVVFAPPQVLAAE